MQANQKPHKHARTATVVAMLSCMAWLGGCAGSQESERHETSAHAQMHEERREAREEAAAHDNTVTRARTTRTTDAAVPVATSSGTSETTAMAHPADNTARNKVDVPAATLTPLDQGNNTGDLQLTAAIRKAIVGDDALSFNAKNVKIIANGGEVVLRGPVATVAEKARVEAHAQRAAGSARVSSQLEVK
jgi:osmotically-inducible protein OsmY